MRHSVGRREPFSLRRPNGIRVWNGLRANRFGLHILESNENSYPTTNNRMDKGNEVNDMKIKQNQTMACATKWTGDSPIGSRSVTSASSVGSECCLRKALSDTSDFHFDMSSRWKTAFLDSMEDTMFPVRDLDTTFHKSGQKTPRHFRFMTWQKP